MKTQAQEQIARAVLQEMDLVFRRYSHQTLADVIQDLAIRKVLGNTHPPAPVLLHVLHDAGILKLHGSGPVAAFEEVLRRYETGIIGTCVRCRRRIAHRDLLRSPSVALCHRCRAQNGPRVSPVTQGDSHALH